MKADSPGALDASLAQLAPVLSLPEANSREQAVQIKAVIAWLNAHERWLLIIDDIDDDAGAKAVRDRLPPGLPGDVLITSRLTRWPVNMASLSLELLETNDAADFLLKRVAKEGHDAGDEAAAKSLARELGNLPLALEQAAALIIEVKWTFAKSVAQTWLMTLDKLTPLARALLRLAAWFAPAPSHAAYFQRRKRF